MKASKINSASLNTGEHCIETATRGGLVMAHSLLTAAQLLRCTALSLGSDGIKLPIGA
ncbi:MAG TPA: hypothetical protein V6D33_18105 [Cyanophyceae cyanobacterium]